MKKSISRILSIVIFFAAIFCVSGTAENDELKNLAGAIANKLFSSEENAVEQVVYTHDLKGLDGEEDYIIAEGQAKGYVIFSREDLQIIEYSAEGKSPFNSLEKNDSYYAGPANYFTKENDDAKHIFTGEKIKKENLKVVSDKLKTKISETKKIEDEFTDEPIIEKPVIKEENSVMSARKSIVHDSNISLYSSDPGPTGTGTTGGGYVDIDQYGIVSQKYIPNYQYFVKGPAHHKNETDECVIVAAQLLLGYNNWVNDGRLIATNYLKADESLLKKPNDESGYGTKEAFFDLLAKDYIEKVPIIGGSTLAYAESGINRYVNENVVFGENETANAVHYSENVHSIIKETVDSGNALMVSMHVFSDGENDSIEKKMHAVVVYGYQTINVNGQNVEGYISHFGWDDGTENVWFNSSWVIDCMTFTTTHTHGPEVPITIDDNNTHITQCSVCNRYQANDLHYYNNITIKSINGDEDNNVHILYCICGYKKEEIHSYASPEVYPYYHVRTCTKCEHAWEEEHFFKYGNTCLYCNYSID